MKVEIVSASAGTGKTWRLSRDLTAALLEGSARPEGVVAITYTKKAAGELESRIRAELLENRRPDLAARVRDGYLGTIHAVCQRLLREFALEAGLSPYLEPIPDSERRHLFSRALARVIAGRESALNELAWRLSLPDWQVPLRDLVERARENGMEAAELAASAAESRRTLDALLPPVTTREADYRRALARSLGALLPVLRQAADAEGTGAARGRAAAADRLERLMRRGLAPWKDQVQLAGKLRVKKLAPAAGPFLALVDGHTGSEPFQSDLRALQAELFGLAGEAVAAFAAEKARSRVVDFGDMLALASRLLGRPGVAEALRARLDLVLVDEFQDTSPIQLAVAASLGALARRSIWVGDRKQAIFGFQGSDPDLMTAAVEAALEGRPPDLLRTSYRSRPPLVALCSGLFSRALEPLGFPAEQVRLAPEKPDPAALDAQPPLETWRWQPEKAEQDGAVVKASEAHAVAAGVEALLAAPPQVRERVAGGVDRLRPAGRRDVAVLARRNERCREVAEALRARGIPATVSLPGLAAEPECLLARAALALLADAEDGIAALEVSWLGGRGAADPDAWLSRRLLEMAAWRDARDQAEKAGAPGPRMPAPFADDPRVAALRAATSAHLSPAEALDLALRVAGLPELLRGWPEPGRRLANLEALRAEARAYEELCRARRAAATVLGLVAHLSGLDGEAPQATPTAEDAVQVTTWHAAKGLEWPVVVLADLDFARAPDPFAVAVEPAGRFDFAAPLAGRWLRFWPWPYGDMSTGLSYLDAASASPAARRARARHAAEQLRLLYVGFTRARDLIVLVAALDAKKGLGAASLAPFAGGDGQPLAAFPFDAPPGLAEVTVGEERWPCRVRALSGLPPAAEAPEPAAVRWYAPGAPASRPPERVNPSSEPLPSLAARLVAVTPLAGRRPLAARADQMNKVGDAIHGFLAADAPGAEPGRLAMAARLLSAHGVAGAIDPRTLLEVSGALTAWAGARYPGARWLREWPVRARLPGPPPRLLVGEADLVLELPDGFVLVDHKSFPGGEAERDRRLVGEWAPQLGWYALSLAGALGKPLRASFIHLPIRGEVAEVALG
ncbi:MAG: UvrD-helicase domain-containing protein [Deltaproteobacteria bacterium]|nr:UvrD-helicase domain-containing protein [Deltaproteobacteria bacterium]